MSSAQLAEWMAYAKLEPFGEERADLRAGIIASVIANVNRDPKKQRPFKPEDFMPKFGQEKGNLAERIKAVFTFLRSLQDAKK